MSLFRSLLVSALFLFITHANAGNFDPSKPKVALFTIPKAGTHLLNKAIELITSNKVIPTPQYSPNRIFESGNYYVQHITDHFDFLKEDQSIRKILLIRDPRDVLISQIFWLQKKGQWLWCTPSDVARYVNHLPTFDDKLRAVIVLEDKFYSIPFFTKKALVWMKDPNFLTVRFEELVGPEGGGDRELQVHTIKKIAEFISNPLTDEKAIEIASKLYGNTSTFRKGQKDNWKNYFTDEHKALLNDLLGKEMIELGYIQDYNW